MEKTRLKNVCFIETLMWRKESLTSTTFRFCSWGINFFSVWEHLFDQKSRFNQKTDKWDFLLNFGSTLVHWGVNCLIPLVLFFITERKPRLTPRTVIAWIFPWLFCCFRFRFFYCNSVRNNPIFLPNV